MREKALRTLLSAIDFGTQLENLDEIVEAIGALEQAFVELESLESIRSMLDESEGEELNAFIRVADRAEKALFEDKSSQLEEYGPVYSIDDECWQFSDDVIIVQNAINKERKSED